MNINMTPQQAFEYVHDYAKQACLALPQVAEVTIVNDMELTVKAVEGHTFKIPLYELMKQAEQAGASGFSDAELLYYLAKKVNAALGYNDIWPTDAANIYPVIKNLAFIHALNTDETKPVLFQPFLGDLWLCYAVYRENTLHYLKDEHIKYTLHIKKQDLHTLALDNLSAAQSQNAKLNSIGGPVWQLSHEIKYADDASMLLMSSIWQTIIDELKLREIVVAVPNADSVIFCDAKDEQAVTALRQTCQQIHTDSAEPLSKSLFWWNPDAQTWQTSTYDPLAGLRFHFPFGFGVPT